MMVGLTELLILTAILLIILPVIFLYIPIAKKAGFSGWWSILLLIPFLNVVIIWLFAFIEWPVENLASKNNPQQEENQI